MVGKRTGYALGLTTASGQVVAVTEKGLSLRDAKSLRNLLRGARPTILAPEHSLSRDDVPCPSQQLRHALHKSQ